MIDSPPQTVQKAELQVMVKGADMLNTSYIYPMNQIILCGGRNPCTLTVGPVSQPTTLVFVLPAPIFAITAQSTLLASFEFNYQPFATFQGCCNGPMGSCSVPSATSWIYLQGTCPTQVATYLLVTFKNLPQVGQVNVLINQGRGTGPY
jgi:hypothetical protein